jgi:hypothetical protein
MLLYTILIAVTIYILEYYLDFTCHKAGKLGYTFINSHMNSPAVDVLALVTEPQLNSYCAILTLDGGIKIDAILLAQYIFNSLSVSSVIVQVFNTLPTRQLLTVQIRYCTINIARVGAP